MQKYQHDTEKKMQKERKEDAARKARAARPKDWSGEAEETDSARREGEA